MAGNSLFGFLCEFALFKVRIALFYEQRERMTSFTKSETNDGERLACLFWAYNGEEHGEKNEFEANHSFIKSESRITLYLKTTFSPVSLYKKSDENNRSDSAKERNPNPGFFRSSSLQKGFAGTLVRGSESQVQLGLASSWTWVLTKWDWF